MADTCTCPPAQNQSCQSDSGLGVFFPNCQIIPNEDRVGNPYFDVINNITYYSYIVSDDCTGSNGNVVDFLLAICENIPLEDILDVEQQLDGCPSYTSVPYDYNNTGGGTPPSGFRYLRIGVGENIVEGSSGVYRITIAGNTPVFDLIPSESALQIVTTLRTATLTAGLLPGCPIIPILNVTKTCTRSITDNVATLNYQVIIGNPNSIQFTNVEYLDTVSYDGVNITIGDVTVTPDTINVDTTTSGVIILTGNLGNIASGESVVINYSFPIMAFAAAGTFTFSNLAIARSDDIEGSAQCNVSVEVVAITTDNCCIVETDNAATFRISFMNATNSPDTAVDVIDIITIPDGVTVEFTSFDACTATYVDDGQMVPLSTPITNRQIQLSCSVSLLMNTMMVYNIMFNVISTNSFTSARTINNTITEVTLQNPDEQIFLSVTPLPNSTDINVEGLIACSTQSNSL